MIRRRVAVFVALVALSPLAFSRDTTAQKPDCKKTHTIRVIIDDAGLHDGVPAPPGYTCVNDPVVWRVTNTTTVSVTFKVKDFKDKGNGDSKRIEFPKGNSIDLAPKGHIGSTRSIKGFYKTPEKKKLTVKYSTEVTEKLKGNPVTKDPDLEVDPPPEPPQIKGRGRGAE